MLMFTFLPGKKTDSHGAVRSIFLFDLDSYIAYWIFALSLIRARGGTALPSPPGMLRMN
jgi:hypothetical protein